jgi:hypothetical protein
MRLSSIFFFFSSSSSGELNEHANFRSFGTAMLTLFRFSTGENWNGFMYDVAKAGQKGNFGDDDDDYNSGGVGGGFGDYDDEGSSSSSCVATPEYDKDMCGYTNRPGCIPLNGCGTDAVYPYLYSFCIVVTFVALNLFVGVIIDAFKVGGGHRIVKVFVIGVFFSACLACRFTTTPTFTHLPTHSLIHSHQQHQRQDAAMRSQIFKPSDMERFQLAWSQYDEDGTAFIDCTSLLHMV